MAPRSSDELLIALAHPVRRSVIEACLAVEELPVSALLTMVDCSPSALSQHLNVLKRAGLLQDRKDGRNVYYQLTPEPLLELLAFAERLKAGWEKRLDGLGSYLAEHAPPMSKVEHARRRKKARNA